MIDLKLRNVAKNGMKEKKGGGDKKEITIKMK